MKKFFAWIGSILEDHPIRSLFTTLLIFAVLIAGVAGITLSTGNETLVKTDNPVYRSNEEISESFGEETIMILYNGEQEDLLEGKTLEKIWSIINPKFYPHLFCRLTDDLLSVKITDDKYKLDRMLVER